MTNSRNISSIDNVFIQPLGSFYDQVTIRYNITCQQCLCESIGSANTNSYTAVNCVKSNETCMLFPKFPETYKIRLSNGSKLYFLQNNFPALNQCCMSNITDLLMRLINKTHRILDLPFQPASFGYDELNPHEAVVSAWSGNPLYWFDPSTMIYSRNTSLVTGLTITLYNNQTFTSVTASRSIHVRDTKLLSLAVNISYTSFDNVRKIIFLNDGKTMAVTTQANESVTLFNVHSPVNYSLQQELPCPLSRVHGAAKVNESFFYVSTWSPRSVASYSYENGNWTYRLVVNNQLTSAGSHMAVDDCGRIWFVDTQFGLRIFDSSGTLIGSWSMGLNSSSWIYDVLLLPNYVVLVSLIHQRRIVKYDPQVICS